MGQYSLKFANSLLFVRTQISAIHGTTPDYFKAVTTNVPFSPIFTDSGRGTTKCGVKPGEHGVTYSMDEKPKLLQGESGITKPSIGLFLSREHSSLDKARPSFHEASRIFYGITHLVYYTVKARNVGHVPDWHVPSLIGNWKGEAPKVGNDHET